MAKNLPRRISVSEMAPHVHGFLPGENKVNKLSEWLANWIDISLNSGKIKPNDFLPSKSELACHIGVSQGTMQNVFRQVEDLGYLESKQRIGTIIRDRKHNAKLNKLTSKREFAIEAVKKYILDNNYKGGDVLVSLRKLSSISGISLATLRMAVSNLVSLGFISKKDKQFVIRNVSFEVEAVTTETLAEKIALNIEDYINKHVDYEGRLPSNVELAQMYSVSIKTIHDAIKILSRKGIVYTRRGRYGTKVLSKNNGKVEEVYFYERVEQKIRHHIASECKVGDKLPSIIVLAEKYKVSPKTIKKALDNLSEDGYLTFVRGRYGGSFVTDIPQSSKDAYTWLALTSEYITSMEN